MTGSLGSPDESDLRQRLQSLEDFFENGVVGLHLVNADGRILRANRAELEMLGYAPDEYLGRSIVDFHADREVIADILTRLARRENLDRYPARLKHKDGSLRHVLISSSARFENGRFVNTRCFTVDVSEQVAAQAALAQEQTRLGLAAETAQVGVWDWDLQSNAMVYSDVAKAICGFAPGEPVTFEMVRQATHPEDFEVTWPMAQRALDPAVRSREPYEYRVVRPDGTIRWVLAHGRAIFDGEGPEAKSIRYVGAIQDITERRTLAQALQRSQDRLHLAMEAARMAVWDSERGSHVDASRELLRIMGVAPGDPITLDDLRKRYLPGEQARVQGIVQAAVQAGRTNVESEFQFRKADGSPGWLLLRAEIELPTSETPVKAVGVLIDVSDRRAIEAALRESEERLRALADNLPNGMIYQMVSDPDGTRRFTFVSNNCERLNGVTAAEAMADAARLYGLIHPDDMPGMAEAEARAIESGLPFDHEVRMRRPDGAYAWHRLSSGSRVLPDGTVLWDGIQIDVDARHRAEADLQALNASLEERIAQEVEVRTRTEEALRQSQKMEAVGQLTGGVAHDFNNLLTVIIGGLETVRRNAPADLASVQRGVDMALHAADRAAALTKRLLAFSRRQALEPRPADLNVLMRSMTDLLHRTLGEEVELEGVLSPRLWTIEVDPNQLESAILNLALNARDAMTAGGKLTIETANAALDESYAAADSEVLPGQYVMIAVSDTGQGMDAATLAKVFEPFFTTKEVGRGTGLGLSMVYGFVKQSGGHVTIYSEPGKGTTVRLYFPRYVGPGETAPAPDRVQTPVGSGDEVILVVEDSEDVREYSVGILQELGYRVLQAAESGEALALLEGDQPIDLLFTDVVLPGRSGREIAELGKALRPGLRVLFTTGYSRNAIIHHGRLDAGVNLLSKPFTFDELAARVRDVLDSSRGHVA